MFDSISLSLESAYLVYMYDGIFALVHDGLLDTVPSSQAYRLFGDGIKIKKS